MYVKFFKRPIDFMLSLLGILFLSPLLIVVAVLVRIYLGGPVIFKQQRPGMNEKLFTLYKFRTMTNETDEFGNLLPDEIRLTKFGQFLRSSSLDELPELFNILKGDMSFLGPRPLLVDYLPLYDENQRRRHEAKPGLSGYAQINGRNTVTWEEKFDLDVEYIENITFIGDAKIFFTTFKKVIAKEGISSDTSVTMEYFKGTAKETVEL